jgi:hypothetical protein
MGKFHFSLSLFAATALLVVSGAHAAERDDNASDVAKGCTLLFVDDHHVLYRSGTERVLTQATRHPENPVVAETKPWELAIGWTSIHRDSQSGKYQLWYQAHAGKRAKLKSHETVVCYAESTDGVRFVKPDLGLFSFNEIEPTNIVLIGSGGHGDRYCCSVLVDEREQNPSRRYKLAYYDWSPINGQEFAGLHVAFSPDGVHWTKHPAGPLNRTAYGGRGLQPPYSEEGGYVESRDGSGKLRKAWPLPMTMSDACDVLFDPRRQKFVIYGKMWIQGPDGGLAWKHAMGRIESADFLTWSKPELLLAPDDLDPPHVEFHTSPVFFHRDRYFCLNQILHRAAGGRIDIELMLSRDGLQWERPFRQPFFLPHGSAGQFDSRSVFTNSTPVVLPDQIRFYYGAYSQGAIGGGQALESGDQLSGVGLATMPLDRFAGIRPVAKSDQPTLRRPLEHIGQVTLKPLDLAGCQTMTLNADASKGSVHVELLNDEGYRVRGFSKDDALSIHGDSLRHPVRWKERRLEQLPSGRYLLRLHLNHATAYAVSFQ